MRAEKLSAALKEHSRSSCVPVIINVPAGHTNPMTAIPTAGKAWLDASQARRMSSWLALVHRG